MEMKQKKNVISFFLNINISNATTIKKVLSRAFKLVMDKRNQKKNEKKRK